MWIFIPSSSHTWSSPWCTPICQNSPLPLLPPSSLLSVCLVCSPGLVWYHACMHHGPANKLHRVATLLPLSLSCQVEPLKHSPSSPLHFHASIHPSISFIKFSPPWHAPSPAHPHAPHPPITYACTPIRAAEVTSLHFVIPLYLSINLSIPLPLLYISLSSAFHPPTQAH